MNYELMTVIRPNGEIWEKQKEQLQQPHTKILSISPMPDFQTVLRRLDVTGINLLDELTNRSFDPETFLFFNQVPTVKNAEIFMNENRSISILYDGSEIGKVFLYPQTRRHVREVRYLHADRSLDFVEEYSGDGKVYSHIFYDKDQVQEIQFLNDHEQPIVTYYFYQGQINFITIRDPETLAIRERYQTLAQFIAAQLAKVVNPEDTVTISYLGMELFALEKTTSYNILRLMEEPIGEDGQIKGNLRSILENKIAYVHRVKMKQEYYEQLKATGVNLQKIDVEHN